MRAIFGAVELDLREAAMVNGNATLDVTIMFGGIELWVPKSWKVSLQTSMLFGGIDDNHQQPDPSEATGELTIVGSVLFGGIEVQA